MSNSQKETAQDFMQKILWEGGLYGAADYGLKAEDYDLPSQVATAWQEFVTAFRRADGLADTFTKVANDAGLEME